ncbi:MAG: sulfatase-like hydrolase/transferase [Alphaproteobacteria bacterium]|nr:sulfatase-like hydrolase/transferase [Alphaproteobacteria bacterium]
MTEAANMIFFMSDNHTRNVVGAYGHPFVQTPALDRIAARGVRFDNAYCASPLCCASRAALATGRYPHQTGFWDNALAYDGSVPTWHHRVRESGAAVTSIGKLHYRSTEDDNGFSEEIIPMHIVEGKGALIGLLRATDEGVPPRTGPREMYGRSGIGEADYQRYDRDITKHAIEWLNREGAKLDRPWVLYVSYASPHPPFAVPKRLYDLYPPEHMPLPVQFTAETRPDHPAINHVRRVDNFEEPFDEEWVRRTVAGYCGLITHTDEQIGEVMSAAEELGLLETTRVVYTSDHGEAAGNHGLFAKSVLYDHAMTVPLIMAGPGVPKGRAVQQIVSHVDLYPTMVEAAGASLTDEDADLRGISLWQAIAGRETERLGFGEFHSQSAKVGSFMLRDGTDKLIYHVDMPSQLFDLKIDPEETNDLAAQGGDVLASLENKLRGIVDPEEVDRRAKADQRAHMDRHGGADAVRERGTFNYSPVPGDAAAMETFG